MRNNHPPSGCRWCDHGQRGHAARYATPPGWHLYTPPPAALILARMRLRRAVTPADRAAALDAWRVAATNAMRDPDAITAARIAYASTHTTPGATT